MQSATITRRVNNAQLSPCPPLNSSNCQDSGRVSQQGFKWLFACISRVHLIFHFGAAMRCFYYLCNADTNTLRSGSNPAALAPSLPSLGLHLHRSQVAGRRTLRHFPIAIFRFIVKWFRMHDTNFWTGEGGREEGPQKGFFLRAFRCQNVCDLPSIRGPKLFHVHVAYTQCGTLNH